MITADRRLTHQEWVERRSSSENRVRVFVSQFWDGIGAGLDSFGRVPEHRFVRYFNERTDAEALQSDWEWLGRDLSQAVLKFEIARGIPCKCPKSSTHKETMAGIKT